MHPLKKLIPLTTGVAERIRDYRFKQRIDRLMEAWLQAKMPNIRQKRANEAFSDLSR